MWRMSCARVHPMAVVSPVSNPSRASSVRTGIAPSAAALMKEEADAKEPSWKTKTLALFLKSPFCSDFL